MSDELIFRRPGTSTLGIHGGQNPRSPGQPVVPPIVQSATFFWGDPGDGELLYSRYGNNPNQEHLGRKLAALEGTEAAAVFGSGMAATAMTILALTQAGDHIVASSLLYGATQSLLRDELPRRRVETTFVDPESFRGWREAVRPNTRVILIETPTNPVLRVLDPRPIAALAMERGLTLVMDATFASPVNLKPVPLGVDAVIHSATKYLGGHSDLIAGVVCGSRALVDEVVRVARLYGPALDPHAAWLLDRGLRTLDLRVRRHNENAMTLAMLSIVLKGGGAAADRFMDALELAMVAPSLGGVETLISQPRYTSHAGLSAAQLSVQGIEDGFVRISAGVEDVDDLIADFSQALETL
jgi:cystathionine beta-lyase/cystathionine gamma-synthase